MKVNNKPNVKTEHMGGVPIPSTDVLKAMHRGQYILHARGGKLTEVPVEKVLLPHSNNTSPQGIQGGVDLGLDGTIYVRQPEVLCKSTDGGRTWSATPVEVPGGGAASETEFDVGLHGPRPFGTAGGLVTRLLSDGTWIVVEPGFYEVLRGPAIVWTSTDQGRTWTKRAEIPVQIPLPDGKPGVVRGAERTLCRLQDDTLLCAFTVAPEPPISDAPWADVVMHTFRSTDGGRTWQGPAFLGRAASEGYAIALPSGRVLATVRYQRPKLPGDPPETDSRGFKNVFLTDSEDGGRTWSPLRQLTSVYGQTFGYPVAQSDGTVAVIHDTRYGPGSPGSRALVSRDGGTTWEDEVYCLDYTVFTGSYTASISLEDGTILTIAGSSQAGNDWAAVKDNTDLYAIRWKPVARAE